jgi:hypothetical protein
MKPFPTDRASNIQNQCFTVAVGTQLTISHDQHEESNRDDSNNCPKRGIEWAEICTTKENHKCDEKASSK